MSSPIPSINCKKLSQHSANYHILDVREADEYEICNIGGQLIPLAELPDRLDEIGRDKPLAVHCKSGKRSAKAVEFLCNEGYDAYNLDGGILTWIDTIDPSLEKY